MRRIQDKRYEVRSSSHTAWWRTDSLAKAFQILRSHGAVGDYVHDNNTDVRAEEPRAERKRR
jgi:hypothetical protein